MPRRKKQDLPQEELKKIKTPAMIKGMRDVLPADEKYWDAVENKIRAIVADYTFKRLRTPIMEKYELFSHVFSKSGQPFEKSVFSFVDRGEKIILRPDLIPSMVRAYLEHNMANQPKPVKIYDWGQVFRQSNDKDRQLTQASFEIIGDASPAIDSELIVEAYYFMKNLGLATEVKLNSAGCLVCRLEYNKALNGFLKAKRGLLCADCRRLSPKTPQKFLTCQNPKCVRLKEDAPQAVDWLCEGCRAHLFKVLEYLDVLQVPYQLEPQLTRQYDFNMRTIFEIRTPVENGEFTILANGGRHDYLLEMLGGLATPAVGLSIDSEKVVNRMKIAKVEVAPAPGPDVYVAQISEAARQRAFDFFEKLRKENFSVRSNLSKSSLKAQLESAVKMKAKLVIILGQKEVNEGTVLLRDVDSGIQEVINGSKVVNEVKKRLKEKADREK